MKVTIYSTFAELAKTLLVQLSLAEPPVIDVADSHTRYFQENYCALYPHQPERSRAPICIWFLSIRHAELFDEVFNEYGLLGVNFEPSPNAMNRSLNWALMDQHFTKENIIAACNQFFKCCHDLESENLSPCRHETTTSSVTTGFSHQTNGCLPLNRVGCLIS